jgi:hypothetical protein
MGKDVGFYMVSRVLESSCFLENRQITSLSYIIR